MQNIAQKNMQSSAVLKKQQHAAMCFYRAEGVLTYHKQLPQSHVLQNK